MDKTVFDISELIYRRISGEPLTDEESSVLQRWMDASAENAVIFESLNDSAKRTRHFLEVQNATERMKDVIDDRLKDHFRPMKKGLNPFWKKWPYWAAALLVALTTAALYLGMLKWGREKTGSQAVATTTIEPGSDKATLTLADGTTLPLHAKDSGLLTKQGKASVSQHGNGQLTYQDIAEGSEVVFNIISTPRGGQYRIALADGSTVILNAATRLRFPSNFTEKNRQVELLEGEAYFEIAPDKTRSFSIRVSAGADDKPVEVTVLGTHFNIRAYPTEKKVTTTLIEGKVAMQKGDQRVTLGPLQQGNSSLGEDELELRSGIKADTVIDWTQGLFICENEKLSTFLHKISMWYDVDIVYKEGADDQVANRRTGVTSRLSRNTPLSEVIRVLERVGIKVEVRGRTITVFL